MDCNGVTVSSAPVLGWTERFPFMDKRDAIYIGHCKTVPEHRGKGFYPILLTRILADNEGVWLLLWRSRLTMRLLYVASKKPDS